jgi:hypothetical protein
MNPEIVVDQEDLGDMTCQLCLSSAATRHVTDRSPAARSDHRYYCSQCYEAKYLNSPRHDNGSPRPRFAIKNLMVLVAMFSVPNAIAAWTMNSGFVLGTPIELRRWTISAFLAANLVPAFFVFLFAMIAWTDRVRTHNWTGGVRIPELELTPGQRRTVIVWLLLYFAWSAFALLLPGWLVKKWPDLLSGTHLFFLILPAPLPLILIFKLRKDRTMRNRIRQDWKVARWPERLLRIVTLAWLFGTFLVLGLGDWELAKWGFRIWFPIPPALLLWFAVTLSLYAAMAMSTSRR